jgi:hypothetical protein
MANRSPSGGGGESEAEPQSRAPPGAEASGRVDGGPQLLRGRWRARDRPAAEAPARCRTTQPPGCRPGTTGAVASGRVDGEPKPFRGRWRARGNAADQSAHGSRGERPSRWRTAALPGAVVSRRQRRRPGRVDGDHSSSGSGGVSEAGLQAEAPGPVPIDTTAQVADRGARGAKASGGVEGRPQLFRERWRARDRAADQPGAERHSRPGCRPRCRGSPGEWPSRWRSTAPPGVVAPRDGAADRGPREPKRVADRRRTTAPPGVGASPRESREPKHPAVPSDASAQVADRSTTGAQASGQADGGSLLLRGRW